MREELNVKVGDKVIVSRGYGYGSKVEIVDKITPSGRIKIGCAYYDKGGSQIGGSTWNRSRIVSSSTEQIVEVEHEEFAKNVLYKLHNLPSVNYEQAVAIDKILNDTIKEE